jgi:transcriptional regulator with XRE-family HTH domain
MTDQPTYPTATIAERRRALGLTQMQLCAELGCTIDTVRRWETGRGNPNEEYQEALDRVLGRPAITEQETAQ